jgi:hypothetical protein
MVSTRGFLVASMTLMRFWCVFLLRVRRVGVVVVPMVLFRLNVFQFLEDILRLRTTRQKKAKRNRNGDGV